MPQEKKINPGSQPNREPEFLILGKLRRAHGLNGEIPLELHTKMLELLNPGSIVYIGDAHLPYTIEKPRWKKPLLLLKFRDISDRTTVSELTNQLLHVKTAQLEPLPGGEFYYHELIGVEVYDNEEHFLGTLEEILETGANDVYVIRDKNKKETLVPAIEDVIQSIDMENGRMIVMKMTWYGEGK